MAEFVEGFDKAQTRRIEAPDVSEIKKFLQKEIQGQEEAVEAWAQIIHRVLMGTPKMRKGPLAVLTEIGPSGVGKTEIAMQAARFLSSLAATQPGTRKSENASILRVDCGEFQSEHEVAKVIGAPPGYVGSDIVPRLAQSEINKHAIRLPDGRMVTVVLMDEIEKAHQKINVTLLGSLDYGVLTLGNNQKVNLENCILVFTSNLGNKKVIAAQEAAESRGETLPAEERQKMYLQGMREHFSPEQLSRMGGKNGAVFFNELSPEVVRTILFSKLTKLERAFARSGAKINFKIDEGGVQQILTLGYSRSEGVRTIENVLEQQIASRLVGLSANGQTIDVHITAEDGSLAIFVPASVEMKQTSELSRTTKAQSGAHTQLSESNLSSEGRAAVASIKTSFGTSPSSAVNAANRYIDRGVLTSEEARAVFYMPEMQARMGSNIEHQFSYNPAAAVATADNYVHLGIMSPEGKNAFFSSQKIQARMASDIEHRFSYNESGAVATAQKYLEMGIMTNEGVLAVFYSPKMQARITSNIEHRFSYNPEGGVSLADNYIQMGILAKETADALLANLQAKKLR